MIKPSERASIGAVQYEGHDLAEHGQVAFLNHAKAVLSRVHKKMTWDRMAELAEIESQALKTYRMPENSPDHRAMPQLVRRQIEALLEQAAQSGKVTTLAQPEAPGGGPTQRPALFELVAPALAALVVRTAAQLHNEGMGVVVSGVDRRAGSRVGLSAEDRRTMALVSRALLTLGLPDASSEIHNLLALCKRPLAEWLPLPEILEQGFGPVRLIDPEQLMPTLEAEGLAEDVAGLASLVEEQLFGDFREALAKLTPAQADEVYTAVRGFVVRHPVVNLKELEAFLEDLPSGVANRVRMGFYEPLSACLDGSEGVALCSRCGNLTKAHAGGAGGWLCTTSACQQHGAAPMKAAQPGIEHFRLARGLRQYWLEPGIDEVLLFDALQGAGLSPRLYPHRDRVDIDLAAASGLGLDLKAYASPELLGRRLKKRPGGLAFYTQRWLVVPDWLANAMPGYMDRLKGALGAGSSIQAMTVGQALKRALSMQESPGA
jgi:REase associating with pPIWI_RE/pPIWI_RE three-gene island domain Y